MSKLTFWGRLFCPTIAERSDCHLKKWLGRLDGVDQHDKNVLVVRGGFLFARLFVLGELALCKSPRRLLFVKE